MTTTTHLPPGTLVRITSRDGECIARVIGEEHCVYRFWPLTRELDIDPEHPVQDLPPLRITRPTVMLKVAMGEIEVLSPTWPVDWEGLR